MFEHHTLYNSLVGGPMAEAVEARALYEALRLERNRYRRREFGRYLKQIGEAVLSGLVSGFLNPRLHQGAAAEPARR